MMASHGQFARHRSKNCIAWALILAKAGSNHQIVRRILILLFLWLVVAGPAFGMSDELPVTPSSLDTYFYTFAVSTNTVTNGVGFHITISAKRGDIDTNYCNARLDTVRHDHGSAIFQEPFETAILVTVQKQPRK